MKKFLIASGVASLAFAAIAMAQGYSFNTNLTVGSTGADVTALQTYLIGAGFNIPAIADGCLAPSELPGHGVSVNEDEIGKHPYSERNFMNLFSAGWEKRNT